MSNQPQIQKKRGTKPQPGARRNREVAKVITDARFPGVEIGLCRPALRDAMLNDILLARLPDAVGLNALYQAGYCKTMCRTVYVTGFDYVMPTSEWTPKQINDAYEKFLDLDEDLAAWWAEEAKSIGEKQVPNHEKPDKQITSKELSDPNSSRRAPRSRTKSSDS